MGEQRGQRADGPAPALACTLYGGERIERAAGWRAVLASVVVREAVPGGLRLRFDPEQVRLGALAELAAAEADCCALLDLGLQLGPAPTLEVRTPAEARVVIDELFVEPDA